jgi:hypothetical protein
MPSRDSKDCGVIDAAAAKAAGVPEGPIRLLNGWPGKKGWGWRHVTSNPDRVKVIGQRGFATPLAFALAVGQGWEAIHAGPTAPGTRITVCMPKDGFDLALALEWSGTFWSITTMLPFRSVGYAKLFEK